MLKEATLQPTIDLAGLQLARDGAQRYCELLSTQDIAMLRASGESLLAGRPGVRILDSQIARWVAAPNGALMTLRGRSWGPPRAPCA